MTCRSCLERKTAEPQQITQRCLTPLFGIGFWLPRQCAECNRLIEAKAKARAAMEAATDLRNRLVASGLPQAYLVNRITTKHLDAAPQTDGFRAARIACSRLITGGLDLPWLFLWSEDSGTSKSMLGCLTLREAIVVGWRGAYLNWPLFLERLKSTYNDDSEETVFELLQFYIQIPWLLVDELGAGKTKQFAPDILQMLLNGRFDLDCTPGEDGRVVPAEPGRRGMIITSNKSVAGIVEQVQRSATDDPDQVKRIERRLSEPTMAVPVGE